MNIELQEIFCCHNWAIEPIAGQQLYNALMTAIASHQEGIDIKGKQKTAGFFLSKKKSFAGKLYVGDVSMVKERLSWKGEELEEDDEIINVVVIDGAVTRNGGACTYGSKDHRDQILYANTIPQVVGHLFIINTPGGMVSAMPDYKMAFDNCRELGKPTVAFIDGICFSAGMWITSQCDRVVAMNAEDSVGCIGAMSCGELAPHGSVNAVTQERTFILVGKASPDKNRDVIEAAGGNDELLQAEADRNTEHFHKVVRAGRPMVTSDMLTGKIFTAEETLGNLVDEIGNQDRAIECIFELIDGTLKPAYEAAPAVDPVDKPNEEQPTEPADSNENEKPNDNGGQEHGEDEKKQDVKVDNEQPEKETPNDEDNDPENDEEDHSEDDDEPNSPSAETIEEATSEIDRITETLHNAETMIAQKDKTIASLQSVVEKKSDDISSLVLTIKQQADELSNRQAFIDKLTKQIANLRAEVKELSEKPTPMADASAGIPTGNGTGEAPKKHQRPSIKAGMTYEQIRAFVKNH